MNVAIAEKYKELVSALPFTDLVAGLVKVHMEEVPIEGGNALIKSFPVVCDLTVQQCRNGEYKSLMMDDSKKSIIYFEDVGILLRQIHPRHYDMVSRLRLVAWYNLKYIVGAGCSMSGPLIANILGVLPHAPINIAGAGGLKLIKARVEAVTELPKQADIFLKYSYDEPKDQFLLYPYDYFAIEIETLFTVPTNCVPEITMQETEC